MKLSSTAAIIHLSLFCAAIVRIQFLILFDGMRVYARVFKIVMNLFIVHTYLHSIIHSLPLFFFFYFDHICALHLAVFVSRKLFVFILLRFLLYFSILNCRNAV